ncbi:MAG: hydantoinase/oxoprolinase family protein [Pseudotabrizicola sp.]|uniref:hydantoinase/oxoprolinase family protein n=2 Tax=Pseudotabrizicola sp. TaxID=2939647 RepID=UPI00272FC41A|nr:hydantoinase/oxoprolinase family protein [Pseudotabrizicola sp.]MDP2081218.1 hydantoinase/oxoprolinase family protein [Pseudotabrizicola sp.]MDZ7576163.1 hydantoinase/oxoprolinase family protein [Pseudotabrizicola sp.]
MAGLVAGVDVGGTFTDLVIVDPATGAVKLAKVSTTLPNQAPGVLNALAEAGADLSQIDLIVHGTTTTTNAVLERTLAKTGLITTMGFRDILELGRRTRPNAYGMHGRFTPIIPRDLRLEVPERMDARGSVLVPLDADAMRKAALTLREMGCESLVIHFLHAYANPAHERRAAEIAAEVWPNSYITMGHSLLSESREYERGVTAAVNASVQPLLERYVSRLADQLTAKGYRHDLLVMNGNGGMVSAKLVSKEAVKTVMSGPASGVMAAVATGRRAGINNLLTYDMGGTSTDVAMIRDGRAPVSNEIEVEYAMPIHVPMVDVRTVGAGGGSIARIDAGGMLRVGPDSAGSTPGPVCYGRGGTKVTISDANLLLGRLPASRFGQAADAARQAMADQIAAPLGLSVEQAAEAVVQIANVHMAGAIRMVSISMGADPRDFALFAFGGAGPLHAVALARELAVPKVLIPARPGITNALGCVVADLRQDFVRTLNQPLDHIEIDTVHGVLADQEAEGRRLIGAENIRLTNVRAEYSADMQFVGQTHLLRVALPNGSPSRAELQRLFEAAYHLRFRVELPTIKANLVNLNVSVIGERPEMDLSALIDRAGRRNEAVPASVRAVWFNGWVEAPVYWRDHLPLQLSLQGPAIIEQMDTTIVIEPGCLVTSDSDGNLIVQVSHA